MIDKNKYTKPFKILSIDGGAIKGIFASKVLEVFEEFWISEKKTTYEDFDSKNFCIKDEFHLICGTSIGGIIALLLCNNVKPKEITNFFLNDGKKIFGNSNSFFKLFHSLKSILFKSKYSSIELEKSLKKIFENKTMNSLQSNPFICIPTYNYSIGQPTVIKKSIPILNSMFGDIKLVDICLATSAAPSFFPIHEIKDKRTKYIDGGLWANNPSMVGYIEAKTNFFLNEAYDFDSIEILSLGNVKEKAAIKLKWYNKINQNSILGFNKQLVSIPMNSQSQHIDFYFKQLSKVDDSFSYNRIELEGTTIEHCNLFSFDNYDKELLNILCSYAEDQARKFLTNTKE